MAAIFKSLSSFSTWSLPGLFTKGKSDDDTQISSLTLKEKTNAAAKKVLSKDPLPPTPIAKVDTKKTLSPEAIKVAKQLPEDTLLKLYDNQEQLIEELNGKLADPEKLTQLGQWEETNDILNDLLLTNFQFNTLAKAKIEAEILSEEEKTIVNNKEKQSQILHKLKELENNFRELSETLHKNIVKYKYKETETSEQAVLELLVPKGYVEVAKTLPTAILKFLPSFPPLPRLFTKEKSDNDTPIAVGDAQVRPLIQAERTKTPAIKPLSPEAIKLAKQLPKDTLLKLYDDREQLLEEFNGRLADPEKLTQLGRWEEANGILNDLLFTNTKFNTLAKAKAEAEILSEEEKTIVNNQEKESQILDKLKKLEKNFRELSKTLHKNIAEYKHRETEASEKTILELLVPKDYVELAKTLPADTLLKLCEARKSLTQELSRMLAKPEKLARFGQWEMANGIFNDLKLINAQIRILGKAKKLTEKEQKAIGSAPEKLAKISELATLEKKLKELSKILHKNIVEYHYNAASDAAILKLLSHKDYKTILNEYAAMNKKYAAKLIIGSAALYTASHFGLISQFASQFHPLLGFAVGIPEAVIGWSPALTMTASLIAPVTGLNSNTLSRGLNKIYTPIYQLSEELYNLKDAAADTVNFLSDGTNWVYGHAKQTITLSAVASIASLTARAVAETGIISSTINTLAPEVAFLAKGAEQTTLFVTKGFDPLTPTGITTIGIGSLLASTSLINNPNIKKPSTKEIYYSVPKAANFIRKAAIVTTVATIGIATYIYAPSMLDHTISNSVCTIRGSVSHLTSSLLGNSSEPFMCAAPAAKKTIVEMISGAASEAIGQTAIFIGKRTALTTAALYTATLPSLVKGAINYGISKVGGSLPKSDSAKTPGPIQSGEKNDSKDPINKVETQQNLDDDGAGIQGPNPNDNKAETQQNLIDNGAGIQGPNPNDNKVETQQDLIDNGAGIQGPNPNDGFITPISKNKKRRQRRNRVVI